MITTPILPSDEVKIVTFEVKDYSHEHLIDNMAIKLNKKISELQNEGFTIIQMDNTDIRFQSGSLTYVTNYSIIATRSKLK